MREKSLVLKKMVLSLAVMFLMVLSVGVTVKAAVPGKVTGLKQTGAADGSVSVSWNAVLGADNYAVYVSEDKVNWVLSEDGTYNPGTTVYKLTPGRTYYMKVCAYNGYSWNFPGTTENGAFSDVLEVTTATSNISNLKMTAATTNSISVSWSKAEGASYYEVSYMEQGSTSYTYAGRTTGSSFKVTKLKADTNYTIMVVPVRKSSVGYVATHYETHLYPYDCHTMIAGNKHKSLGIDTWEGNSSTVTLRWTTSRENAPKGYQIQICDAKKKVIKTYTTKSSSTELKFTNSKIKNKAFQFRVRSYKVINNKNSYGTWSSYKVVVPTCKVTATKKSNTSVKLSWNKVSGATSYTIYYSTASDGKLKKVATVKKNSYTWKKLKKNKDYYVYVKANNVKFGSKKYSSTTARCQKMYNFWIGYSKAYQYVSTRYN